MPEYTVKELADKLGLWVEGDGSVKLNGCAPIELAGEGSVTFLANPQYEAKLSETEASALIVDRARESFSGPQLTTPNPYAAFARALALFYPPEKIEPGIRPGALVDEKADVDPAAAILPGAYVGPRARVGAGSVVHPLAYIGDDAVIGQDCIIYPNATVRNSCRLGDRVIINSNAVIGSDGFGFALDGLVQVKIPQVGIVVVEDDVEIGANSSVDRAVMGETIIRSGAKIDNLVMIAHNSEIGSNTVIAGQSGIAGSTKIGSNCTLGGQVGVAGHLTIGNFVQVGAQTGIGKDIEGPAIIQGDPVMPLAAWLKVKAHMARLPDIFSRVRALERFTGIKEKSND